MKISKEKLALTVAYVVALIMAFFVGGIIILLFTGKDPISIYRGFFLNSFFSSYGILELASKAVPIIIAGSGMLIAFRSGLWNLGAEGQMAIGAIISTALGIYVHLPGIILIPLIFVASFIGGGLWSGISSYLKNKFGVSIMLTTLMMNYIALKLMEYMLSGPMTMRNQPYPRTAEIISQARLPFLKYPLNSTFIIALLIIPIVWFILNRTTIGYRLQAVGLNREAARFAGMKIQNLTMIVMILSGGISALGGTAEIIGDFFCMQRNVTGGYGFIAIVVLMLARENIIALPFAAFFISGITVGATSLPMVGVPSIFSQILIGLLIIAGVLADYIERRLKLFWGVS